MKVMVVAVAKKKKTCASDLGAVTASANGDDDSHDDYDDNHDVNDNEDDDNDCLYT